MVRADGDGPRAGTGGARDRRRGRSGAPDASAPAPASRPSSARSTSWRTRPPRSGSRRSAMGQHPLGGGVVAGENVDDTRSHRRQGDRTAAGPRGDAHAEGLGAQVLERQARRFAGPAWARPSRRPRPGNGRSRRPRLPSRGAEPAPSRPRTRRQGAGCPRPGSPGRRPRRVRTGRRRPSRGSPDRPSGTSRSSTLPTIAGAASPRKEAPEVAAKRSRISSGAGGLRGAAGGAVQLDDLGRLGPSLREVTGEREHRAAPRDGDRAGGSPVGQVVRGRARDGVPRQVLGLVAVSPRGRDVGHHGGRRDRNRWTSCSSRSTTRASGCTTSIRTISSRSARSSRRPTRKRLRPEPLADLFLAEIHPVVHLRDAHHQPRVARTPTPRCGHRPSGHVPLHM